jgi:hypothetical protein
MIESKESSFLKKSSKKLLLMAAKVGPAGATPS